MDPNETLRLIRELIANRQAAEDSGVSDDELDAGRDLAQAVTELDEWLSKGGFNPAEWHPDERTLTAFGYRWVDGKWVR